MKCPHCGNPLNLEDAFCPYCGQPNKLAQKHQADMKHYQQEFQKTQQEVTKKAHRFTSLTTPLIVLFVLFLLTIGTGIFALKSWDIGYELKSSRILKEQELHKNNLNKLIEEKNYIGLYHYYNDNDLYFSDTFNSYRAIVDVAGNYSFLFERILTWHNDTQYHYDLEPEHLKDTLVYLTDNLASIYNAEQTYQYDAKTFFSEENVEILEDIRAQTRVLFIHYIGLTAEEADALPGLSTRKQAELLERRLTE